MEIFSTNSNSSNKSKTVSDDVKITHVIDKTISDGGYGKFVLRKFILEE